MSTAASASAHARTLALGASSFGTASASASSPASALQRELVSSFTGGSSFRSCACPEGAFSSGLSADDAHYARGLNGKPWARVRRVWVPSRREETFAFPSAAFGRRLRSELHATRSEVDVRNEVVKESDAILNPDQHSSIYSPCVDYCVQALETRFDARPFPTLEKHRVLLANNGKGYSRSSALVAPKIRFMRSADIWAGPSLQVLNLVIFPEVEYDFPIFCADLVTSPGGQLVILDLNPQFHTKEYNEQYFKPFLPLCEKHIQKFPWGGEFTAEAIEFFSPVLIWSRLPLSEDISRPVYDAFTEYLDAWLDVVEKAEPTKSPSIIAKNQEAQHKYMCWRIEKDPGRPTLTRLFGKERCEDYIRNFLFHGFNEMGTKTFLDYFPQYRTLDGKICEKRSLTGRKYSTRPWDKDGNLVNDFHDPKK